MAKLLGLDRKLDQANPGDGSAALIQPGEIREHLVALGEALDTDPHYRYGISLEPYDPQFRPEPWLVAAAYERYRVISGWHSRSMRGRRSPWKSVQFLSN
jgi:hypothetical protein